MQKENNITKNFIIGTFVTLYIMVSVISTIHVIDFFELSNPKWLAITLALAFEVGSAASLASIIALKKMNKGIVWALFFILTAMQAMGNAYFAYTHLKDYQSWVELFGLIDYEPIFQKRVLSIVSGAILPLVALGFIKSLVDYIRPDEETQPVETDLDLSENDLEPEPNEALVEAKNKYDEIIENGQKAAIEKAKERARELLAKREQEMKESGETYDDEPTALANSGLTEWVDNDGDDDLLIEEETLLNMQSVEEIKTEEPVIEMEIVKDEEEPTIKEEEKPKNNGIFGLNFEEENVVDENEENYPVYDKTNDDKNKILDNIIVYTKNGDQ